MANFIRRFDFDPGDEVLLEIESVNIIDREPPAAISGVGSGFAILVAEFENGPFETPSEVSGGADLQSRFGSFGYNRNGVPGNDPSARSRFADGAIVAEHWNGHGVIWLQNKKFSRLAIVRVDTSVGEVEFSRIACIRGSSDPTFDLEPAQTITLDIGSGDVTSTFAAAAGVLTSGAGTYPSTFTGGEQMTFVIDEGTDKQVGPVTVTFLSTDQSQAQVIARLNAAAGYTAFADAGGGQTTLTGRIRGTDGVVEVTAIDAAVATATGFSATSGNGSGDVANIDQVTVAEVNTKLQADHSASTISAKRDADGFLLICNDGTPLTGTITVSSATPPTAAGLGFAAGDSGTAVTGVGGVIPAGTVVVNGGAVRFVTMQDVAVTAASAGPYSVKVRHADDDTAGLTSATASLETLETPVPLTDQFAVTNPAPISAALTEAQLDVKYLDALAKTISLSAVTKDGNFVAAARQSNVVRAALRQNALDASGSGHQGRIAVIRPPLGTTTRSIARGSSQPGVGAYRNKRVVYAFPGVRTFIPQIAARGTAGGDGFTADGFIDVGFDSFVCAVMSQLPPEENPGQLTDFALGALAIEAGNADVQSLNINDYKAFRSSGIAAPRIDDGRMIIQSGVTSVDPSVQPNFRNIARQRMSDFITDTLARRLKSFGKKAMTRSRRAAAVGEVRAFMKGLLDDERIDSFSTTTAGANPPEKLAKGIFRIVNKVRTLASFDAIVIDSTVGENVSVEDVATG